MKRHKYLISLTALFVCTFLVLSFSKSALAQYWYSFGDNWSCFPAGTQVLMSDPTSPNRLRGASIENVKAGDVVISQSEKGERSVSKVTKVEQPVRDHMCKINFESGDSLKLTSEHPLYSKNGWVSIDPTKTADENSQLVVNKMKNGDEIARSDGTFAKVDSFSCWSEKIQTYNLILDKGAHTYFADGYLAHNKTVTECPPAIGLCFDTSGWTCFAKGTTVDMGDGKKQNIEDVKVGDKVVSQSETGERSVSTVTKLDQPIREHMCKLDFANGTTVKMTEEHPLMTTEGWKALDPNKTKNENPNLKVAKLQIGDAVVRDDGTKAILENVSCWSERTQAYNLILDGSTHTYFADGFLAHNKDGGACIGYTGLWCLPGTTRTNEIVSTTCLGSWYCGIGDAQRFATPDEQQNINLNNLYGTTTDCGYCRPVEQCEEVCHANGNCILRNCAWVTNCLSPQGSNQMVLNYACQPPCDANVWGAWSPTTYCGTVTQTRTNQCGTTQTRASACTECGPHISAWSACDANHKRTRTCTSDCGGASVCANVDLSEDCEGVIRGTLFDATDLTVCPAVDLVTGRMIGVDTTKTANSRTFDIFDKSNTAPHPWSLLSSAVTDSTGNYSVRVYAPATYDFDFSTLSDMYVVSEGPKLICSQVSTATTVPNNSPLCLTQPCSYVNVSFGFDRYWSGWWQAVGASVHGDEGVKSGIPSSYTGNQFLILGDVSTGNRSGVVSYGTLIPNMLGLNPSAKASSNLWQVESKYKGVIYDYAFFNQQFKKYTTTNWDGTSPLVYEANGKDYQIFKVNGSIANFNYSPTGTQKVILLVNGDVTISANLIVPNTAFMAVLASGDISFASSVTRADGWYLGKNINVRCADANSDLVCDKTDSQFLGNGSFVSWKKTNLMRDRGGAGNIAGPAEKFTYRLDLYNNAPEPMKNVTKMYKPFVP